MSVSALRDVVIIRRLPPEAVSDGGIHIAWDPDYKEDIGIVVSAGSGREWICTRCKHPHKVTVSVKPGDKVIFSTHGHQITTINGEELVVTRENSIIGVIDDAEPARRTTCDAEEVA